MPHPSYLLQMPSFHILNNLIHLVPKLIGLNAATVLLSYWFEGDATTYSDSSYSRCNHLLRFQLQPMQLSPPAHPLNPSNFQFI